MTTVSTVNCPRCSSALDSAPHEHPWCPECEWNLDQVATDDERRRSAARRRRAFRANQQLLEDLRVSLPARPSVARGTLVRLAVASLLLLGLDVAMLAGGLWLAQYGAGLIRVVGIMLVLMSVECRPRFPHVDADYGRVTRDAAPHFWQVVDEARRAVGAPPIHVLVLTDEFNAFCGRTGPRRRAVLGIGLPVWAALSPAGRSALLGHELGHLVNGDPTTAFLTQPALVTLVRLSRIFQPRQLFGRPRIGHEGLTAPLAWMIFWPLYLICSRSQAYLSRVASRDHQRAEAYADALAVSLGGSAGAAELMDVLLFQDAVQTALIRAAIAGPVDPTVLHEGSAAALDEVRPRGRRAEQRSLRRDASPYASHPPTGVRRRLVACWPTTPARTVLPAATWAAADRDLAAKYATLRRHLINTPIRR